MVGGSAPPSGIKFAEQVLRLGDPLFSGLHTPLECRLVVSPNTVSVQQHDRNILLRVAMSLLGSALIPEDCLCRVLLNTLPSGIHHAHTKLRFGMTMVGGRRAPLDDLFSNAADFSVHCRLSGIVGAAQCASLKIAVIQEMRLRCDPSRRDIGISAQIGSRVEARRQTHYGAQRPHLLL